MLKTPLQNQNDETAQCLDTPASNTLERYKVQSNYISWDEAEKTLTIIKPDNSVRKYDFRTFYFPPSAGIPYSESVASNDLTINTLLFQIDISLDKCSEKSKKRLNAVSLPIQIYMCVMTYFRDKGIYALSDITTDDLNQLKEKLVHKNWHYVLNLDKLWQQVFSRLNEHNYNIDIGDLFHTTKQGLIYGLKTKFWEKEIGYSATTISYSTETKRLIAQYCEKRNYRYCKKFKDWLEKNNPEKTYTQTTFRKQLDRINLLATKHNHIDYLKRIPFINSNGFSKKQVKGNKDGRTANLKITDATYLIQRAFQIVFDTGPAFLVVLKNIMDQKYNSEAKRIKPDDKKVTFRNLPTRQASDFLTTEKPFDEFTNSLGLRQIRYWAPNPDSLKSDKVISLLELIAIIQGACCFIILILNARRIGEVIDKKNGLRTTDLRVIDEELGIFQCLFYIEKTYQERHTFYVNRSTACAIQLLIDMKATLSEFMSKPDRKDLFSICNPLPLMRKNLTRFGKKTFKHFEFETDSILSFNSLMRFIYPNSKDAPVFNSHMGRRFFALLKMYRYDNPVLLSLSQHLRHSDIAQTVVYVTDPDLRDTAKDIASTIGKLKDVSLMDKKLFDSLEIEKNLLLDEIEKVGKERLTDVITRIISGEESAGGFSRYIRKLFKSYASDIKYVELSTEGQGEIISERLINLGYKPECLPHGQCNAPENRNVFNAKCRDEKSATNKERACASVCRECQYHYNNHGFLQNLEEDAKQLKQDIDDFMLPPIQQQRAKADYDNLIQIIELNKQTMAKNTALMLKTRAALYE